jgi:hypothetical protein
MGDWEKSFIKIVPPFDDIEGAHITFLEPEILAEHLPST